MAAVFVEVSVNWTVVFWPGVPGVNSKLLTTALGMSSA